MKRARFPRFPSLLLTALLFWLSSNAQAQSGGGYDLSWSTIDGGGATFSSGGSYSLGGIGQADAEAMLSGGSYTLSGGFWGSGLIPYGLYLPLVLRNP